MAGGDCRAPIRGSTEYVVLNEHQEDITHEIKKLVSFKTRMLKGR
jgi:hypothetical protein